ncbi:MULTISPECIES: sensor domain-containing diguanylate cyclase [Achromobacter]|uniref:Sensor domain-containing diguanylate cyclase n=1 Tax=Achromobacter spanius TaxID=217203 RepID=A0ABY8GUJ9_9BURK|nr:MULTISPECIES: sensor domain-containing diguanylate cyclase [Achromobacter]WAI82567.1 GGDEF domain-containing protein [Achromobacter spanius]WEX92652.1 GGDEF domain-containing protein [Achromobacter sp. SS2-2022]WFP08194.1 sensor domain-containing diguanylate cyclase [Achromobacter spanius]
MTAGLQVLAASEELYRGDLQTFHAKARQIAQLQDVDSYTLIDSSRMQVLNTRHDAARPAVRASVPEEMLNRVFSYRSVAQTDLFRTPTNRYLVAISVPVVINDDVRYSLQAGISPDIAGKVLRRQALGQGWVAALLDSQGIIAGRTRDEERFIGQPAVSLLRSAVMARSEDTLESTTKEGISVFTAFTHTMDGKWTVVVGAPTNVLLDELTAALIKVILAGATIIGLGVALAVWMAHAIERSIAALIEPAVDLGRGGAFVAPPTHFVETAALGAALTETSHMLARAQQMAYHDPLTGLCNRVLFAELANQALAAATRASRPVAFLAIDLDNFKDVNDTRGHAVGDAVLKTVARRMRSAFRAADVIARFGGDEFFVLMDDANAENALSVGNSLVKSLSEQYPGVTVSVGASVGISVFPADGIDLTSLLAEADAALYAAKRAGRGRALHRATLR